MADVNANIDINIDSSNALAQLKSLQRQISQFHTSIARSSEAAALAQKGLQKNLLNSVNAIGSFTAEMRTVKTSAESFTDSLEKNKFSMREYFRYAGASTKTFGRLFKSEFDTIGKVSEERVKRLQTQYIKMGRDTNGAMRAMAIMPTQLNMSDYTTQVQMAAQKQALFNQLMKQGSTNLLNFGKNTQWAGRQLMVGFTLPLMAVGTAATKTFMDMEAQALRFRKVYGDLFTPQSETQAALDNITELGKQFTKYGVAVSTTVGLAAEAAAAGFQGLDLQRQTTEATRLSILGQVDSQKALETTISLQNAFAMSSESLADSINFLNAVENQTVVSLDDITTAIPKVAPVIQQLGGDVKDLTFFIAAMKEGGINASEGANALKSGLAALINPTKKASDMLASFGINATAIVEKNKGDLKATVVGFAEALNTLDPLARARAIEQMFGKFQFARLSTLFANVARDGNQAARVLDLANASVEELSALSEQELGMTADSAMNKFKKTVEDLKVALVPVGKAFLEAVTPIIDFVGGVLEKFANLSDGTKRLITLLTVGIGAVGPVLLMTFGLLANGIANIIKLFLTLRGGYQRLTGQTSILGEQTQYMTMEQLDAAAAAHSLNQTHATLTQTFTAERAAINQLISAYNSAAGAARNFSMNNPGMMMPGRGARKLASGIVSVPGPKGAGDVVPAMLSPGESVIPADMTKKYAGLIQGMISDNIPGYKKGLGLGDIKKNLGLFRAPFAVAKQTSQMSWATLPEELLAVEQTATEILNKTVTDAKIVQQKLGNLKRRQASHIIPDVTSMMVGEESVNIKNWKASNLQADLGYVNAYVNTIQQSNTIVENFNKQHIDQAAKTLNMSIDEVTQEIEKFKQGIHPTTRRSASVLRQVAMTDPGYQGQAAATGLGVRLSGNYYETLGSRAYDPAKDINAAKTVERKVAKLEKQVVARSQSLALDAINKTAKAAGTASPSKKTIKIGEDIARGLEVGMQSRQDDVALAGANLGKTATGQVQGGSRQIPFRAPGQPGFIAGNAPTPGVALSEITEKARRNRDQILAVQQQRQTAAMNARMNSLNKAFMSGTFALSALSGVASMAGGNLGKFSEILFQISGPLFALSSVIQLLTGEKIVGIISKFRIALGFGAIALAGLVVGINLINKAREKERMAIEGLANAIKTTKTKLETLGGFFNVTPTARAGSNAVLTSIQTKPNERSQIQALKKTEDFQKNFEKDIAALSQATNEEALLSLQTLALDLRGQGFAKAQVDIIIKALLEEAKKSKLILEFSQLDLSKEEGRAGAIALAQDITKNFNTEFEKGVKKTRAVISAGRGGVVLGPEQLRLTSEQQKQLKLGSQELSNVLAGVTGQFKAGAMKGSEYAEVMKQILASTENTAYGNMLLQKTLVAVNPEYAKATAGVKDYETRLLLLKGALLEVEFAQELVLTAINGSVYEQEAARAKMRKMLAEEQKDREEAYKAAQAAANAGKKELTGIRERIETTKDQIAAFKLLIGKNIDYKTALDLVNDAEIRKEILATQNVKGVKNQEKALRDYIKLVNQYVKLTKQEEAITTAPIDKRIGELENLQKFVSLNEKLIDLRSAPQIKAYNDELEKQEGFLQNVNDQIQQITRSQIEPIQAVIESNNVALEKIALQEDAINEKYNKQVEALDKIATINQDIANIQKQRLSIADALTRGDISTAAQLAQEARAEQAQSAVVGQKDILTRARDKNIAALGRVNIEKQNKELQLQISNIERNQLATLQQQKTQIEDNIEATNRKLKILNASVEKEKESALYAGKTRLEIDTSKTLLELSKGPLDAYADILSNSALSAKQIADELERALKATLAMQNKSQTTYQPIITNPAKYDQIQKDLTKEFKSMGIEKGAAAGLAGMSARLQAQADAYFRANPNIDPLTGAQRRMYGGAILPKGKGGMGIVKSMAFGGRAVGSDTVPAMLTPGEFIVNKAASKAYKPLLERINESKYPGMLGGGGMTQIPVNNISTSVSDNSTAVYNYNLGFSINGASSNANDIARAVMREIKNVDSQRIRGQRR